MREKLKDFYLDWVNNYVSLSVFAEDHKLNHSEAEVLINMGRMIYEEDHEPIPTEEYKK